MISLRALASVNACVKGSGLNGIPGVSNSISSFTISTTLNYQNVNKLAKPVRQFGHALQILINN